MRFVTGGSVVHGNDDEFQIDDTERTVSATKITYSIKFIARNRGSTSISLKKGFEVTADNDTSSNLSVSYTPLVVVVKENQAEKTASPKKTKEPKETATPEVSASSVPSKDPETASPKPTPSKNDIIGSNKLRKLSIGEGVSLAPDFSPEIKKYSAIVTTDEKTLPITYETEDSLAEVVIKGNKKLTEGKNTIKIAVTGTNGKKRVYKLSVTIQKTADSGKGANKLTVSKKNGKTYLLGNTTIQLLTPGKDVIPSGFTETEIEIGGKTVTAYALENSKESSFVLLYGKGNKKELYLYESMDIYDNQPEAETIFLSGLKELETLTIVHMNIGDLGAISEITSLSWIALGCTGITDIMPLRKLENLKFIGIYGNESEAVKEQAGQYFKNVDGLDVDVSEELPVSL